MVTKQPGELVTEQGELVTKEVGELLEKLSGLDLPADEQRVVDDLHVRIAWLEVRVVSLEIGLREGVLAESGKSAKNDPKLRQLIKNFQNLEARAKLLEELHKAIETAKSPDQPQGPREQQNFILDVFDFSKGAKEQILRQAQMRLELLFQDDRSGARASRISPIARMAVRAAQTDQARDEIDQAVLEARSLGASWNEIAQAIGVTSQAAYRRWNPVAKQKHRDYTRERYRPAGESTKKKPKKKP